MTDISPAWLQATLADAAESLNAIVGKLEDRPDTETAEEILRRDIVEVYAKLNYALNSAPYGSDALAVLSEDELVAWPEDMPFATREELEAEAAEAGLEEGADA